MNEVLLQRLRQSLALRAASSLLRQTTPRTASHDYINLADNDYLGLSKDPEVISASIAALHEWGASASASPLVTGYTTLHQKLEQQLADWHGYAHGLLMNSGYAANTAVLGGLPKRGDIVFADRWVHASMIDGILASGARLRRFPHNDLDALERMLYETSDFDGAKFVATESVYSMDGDSPDLEKIASLRNQFGFCWVLDEAHATGWYGITGSGLQQGCKACTAAAADIVVGTLGKGLGSQGAYVLSHVPEVRDTLINFARELIYSTYLAPSCVAAALAAMQCVQTMQTQRAELHTLSRTWRSTLAEAGFAVPMGDSPIIPLVLGDAKTTLKYAQALRNCGFLVSAIRPPTVPENTGRLRISLRRGLSANTLAAFISALKGIPK